MKDLTRYLKSGVAYNRPEASCATIPIALLHQVFAEFLENCQHHVTTVQDNRWLLDLRRAMLLEYAEEGGRASRFREIFTIHTDIDLPNATVPNTKDQTDGHFAINRHFLLITEAKNEWIGIAADPQLQAFVYYIESVRALVKTSEIFKRSPLPCLIIYYVGSLIGFAGVATGAKAQFEPLTPLFDLATNQHDTLALKAVARTLGAVRIALNSLRKYYSELKGLHPSHAMDSPIYPSRTYYTNGSNTRVEFDYKARLDEDKLLFRVLTREDGQERIVKFTQKYSKQAHEYSAAHGIAPILYAVERIGGGWMMIVMEYLNKDNYTLLRDSSIPLENRSNIVANAVSILHQGGYVHGDIRDVNIMVRCDWNAVDSSSGIKLLDFDWAGLDGQAQYPANVNHEGIRRPQEAIDGQHITKDHDITMVGYL
ncbi:hypothetical protein CPB86DRAFT_708723 [Serendipita vermifera]|nr:hypothetical protein CPB86DRAFT_708723 [Serendipita vermifera]